MNMKHITTSILGILLTASMAHAAGTPPAGTFQVDPMHSKVGFEIPHLVISTVEGRFTAVDGTIELKDKFEKSTVKATMDVSSVDTGVSKRDDHLKSPDFFDVAKFPKMTFESTEIKGKPESFQLIGNLTIHGVTKKVTLDGKFSGAVDDGMGNQKIAFKADGKINRKDFGLTYGKMVEAGAVVGDEVTLHLSIEAARPMPKK